MKRTVFILSLLISGIFCSPVFGQQRVAQTQANTEQNLLKLEVKAYPNPVIDQLTIEANKENAEKITLRIFSLIGSEMKIQIDRTEPGKLKVNVADFPPGYYMVSVRDEQTRRSESFRILKK